MGVNSYYTYITIKEIIFIHTYVIGGTISLFTSITNSRTIWFWRNIRHN